MIEPPPPPPRPSDLPPLPTQADLGAGGPAYAGAGAPVAVIAPRRRFRDRLWRVLVGIKDVLALLFLLLFFFLLFAALAGRDGTSLTGTGALVLELDGVISEQPAEIDPFASFSGDTLREYRAADIIAALKAARTDANVKAVVLDLDRFLGAGQVTLTDIGRALDGVRKAGKPVLAYATGYGDDAYQLAAHASEVWIHPLGQAAIAGPGGSQPYLKGLIDKLGITAHIYRVGTFKSAVEPLIRADQSPEAEAAERAYAAQLWDQWRATVAAARPKARIDAFAADPVATLAAAGNDGAKAAQTAGLVDRIGDRDAFARRVGAIAGVSDTDRPTEYDAIELDAYASANAPSDSGAAVAVVPVVGTIVDGEQPRGTAGGDTIAESLADVAADPDAKALVLRVDSPGGSVLASERIRQGVLAVKRAGKPVVVSMGNLAASGGYWVSADADRIFAQPDTITGSIGVFGVIPTAERGLAEIGITGDGIQTTPLSGQPDLLRGTNATFDALAQAGVEQIYDRFTTLVASGRKLPVERVRTIAEGRVWAGGDARQLGLVDQFGGIDAAIADAARRAKLDPDAVTVRYYEGEEDAFTRFLAGLMSDRAGDARAPVAGWVGPLATEQQRLVVQLAHQLRLMAGTAGVQARCLGCQGYAAPSPIPPLTGGGGWWGWFVRTTG